MVERLYKKGLVVGIIVMFFSMTFVSTVSSLSAEKYASADKYITTPPEVEVTWETYKIDGKWYVDFICNSSEGMSDINIVEMYVNNILHATIEGPGPDCIFTIEWSKFVELCLFQFVFYNFEGEWAIVLIRGLDIKSCPIYQQFTNQLMLRFLEQYPLLQKLILLIK
jgi:hypothetical protein